MLRVQIAQIGSVVSLKILRQFRLAIFHCGKLAHGGPTYIFKLSSLRHLFVIFKNLSLL